MATVILHLFHKGRYPPLLAMEGRSPGPVVRGPRQAVKQGRRALTRQRPCCKTAFWRRQASVGAVGFRGPTGSGIARRTQGGRGITAIALAFKPESVIGMDQKYACAKFYVFHCCLGSVANT